MLKKILYAVIVLVIGVIFALGVYTNQVINSMMEFVESAIEEEDYARGVSLFAPFTYDEDLLEVREDMLFTMFYSSHGVEKEIEDKNVTVVEPAFSFLLSNYQDIHFDNIVTSSDSNANFTRIVLTSNGKRYSYEFVTDSSNLLQNVKQTSFLYFSIGLEDIKKEFTTNIESIEFYDSRDTRVFIKYVNISLESEFFDNINDMTSKYVDAVVSDDLEDFEQYYNEEWLVDYEKNPKHLVGIPVGVIISGKVITRVFIYIGLYIVAIGVLGYFIFRRRKEKLSDLHQGEV